MRLKTVFKWGLLFGLFLVFIVIPCCVAAVLVFGLENETRLGAGTELTTRNVQRGKQLLDRHDPRKLKPGEKKSLSLRESDLNLVVQYALSRVPGAERIRTRIDLEKNRAEIHCSFRLPDNPLRNFANLSFLLTDAPGRPELQAISVGKITLKGGVLRPIKSHVAGVLKRSNGYAELVEVADAIQSYGLDKDRLSLVYEWRPEVAGRIKDKGREMLIPEGDRERLLAYNVRIAAAAAKAPAGGVSLSLFMKPVFSLAAERSRQTHPPALENQAAIVALTLFVLKTPMAALVGERAGESVAQPKSVAVKLRGRSDLPKHFMLSAAIAATADSRLSNAIGLFKELDDSRGGSGFSFADLAADRAGVRFAELATGPAAQAERLQHALRDSARESVYMPRIDGLPEGMQEKAFKQKFQGLDSAAYGTVKDEIERRIAACGLYR